MNQVDWNKIVDAFFNKSKISKESGTYIKLNNDEWELLKKDNSKVETYLKSKHKDELALLDDCVILLMIHAFISMFFEKAEHKTHHFPVDIETLSAHASKIGEIRDRLRAQYNDEKNFGRNEYIDVLKENKISSSLASKDKMPRMIVAGYQGSDIYGEWMNCLMKQESAEPSDVREYYGEIYLYLAILTRLFRLVPSDLYIDYYKFPAPACLETPY